jgi:hypothetical protein
MVELNFRPYIGVQPTDENHTPRCVQYCQEGKMFLKLFYKLIIYLAFFYFRNKARIGPPNSTIGMSLNRATHKHRQAQNQPGMGNRFYLRCMRCNCEGSCLIYIGHRHIWQACLRKRIALFGRRLRPRCRIIYIGHRHTWQACPTKEYLPLWQKIKT